MKSPVITFFSLAFIVIATSSFGQQPVPVPEPRCWVAITIGGEEIEYVGTIRVADRDALLKGDKPVQFLQMENTHWLFEGAELPSPQTIRGGGFGEVIWLPVAKFVRVIPVDETWAKEKLVQAKG